MERLTASESQFRTLVENMSEGVVMTDKDGRNIYANPAYYRMVGKSKEEVIGLDAGAPNPDSKMRETVRKHWELRARGVSSSFEFERMTADGRKIPLLLSGAPIMGKDGAFLGSIAIFTDLSEIKKLQMEKEKALRLAAIGEIAAMVSHEIRNPLGAIMNSVYFLRTQTQITEHKSHRHFDIIEHALNRCNHIVYNILDYARPKEPVLQHVSINTLIEEAMAMVTFPESIEVVGNLDPSLPPLHLDPEMMIRVFINLFTNAIEAMPQGGTLHIITSKNESFIEASVEDTGTGISIEAMNRLFEPLFTTKTKGTGLGLYLSRQAVKRHGGEILVQSQPGQGSTFTVRLPV